MELSDAAGQENNSWNSDSLSRGNWTELLKEEVKDFNPALLFDRPVVL